MDKTSMENSDVSKYTYTKQNICDNTLDDAQLAVRCPLDNGRHIDASIIPQYDAGQLDRLPAETLIHVLLYIDVPSLTRFRSVNRRAMDLVDSVPQYAAIVKHCPDIIRAIISIQADAFGCDVLYATLSSTKCATCERFGDHLYLITCRRVCYLCFTRRLEFFPLTLVRASKALTSMTDCKRAKISGRQRLIAADPPSVLSLPGRYCFPWTPRGGYLMSKRLHLFDRQAVVQDVTQYAVPKLDKATMEPLRYMTIITAPYLSHGGLRADWGYFCRGCQNETEDDGKHLRRKYTREQIDKHIAQYGPVKKVGQTYQDFKHVLPE